MHEISLAGGVLELVERCAIQEGFHRVTCVRLEVGKLSGVETDSLRFALQAIAPGTCLEGARIEIDEPAGQAWCETCGMAVAIHERGDPCARCGSWGLQAAGGTGLKVVDLLVDDD